MLEIAPRKDLWLSKEIKWWQLKQRMHDWTLITDVMRIEVSKCALIKAKSKWRSIVMWIKCLSTLVNCECNITKLHINEINLSEFSD